MSTTPTTIPAPLSPTRLLVNPAEYVAGLSNREKQGLLLALLRDALRLNGDTGLLPIDDEDGRPFGYFVPPKAAEALYRLNGPRLSEEEEQEIDRRIADSGPAVPVAEVIADLRRQQAGLRRPQ